MTVGNLFAMRQQNLKRLIAFSSVSQVGFILVGITGNSIMGLDSTHYFMLIYLLSNICFFGVLDAVADSTKREGDLCICRSKTVSATLLFCCIAILSIGFISSVYQYIDWAGHQLF